MMKNVFPPAGRALFSPVLRRFCSGEVPEDVSEFSASPELTKQASLYVHVSLFFLFLFFINLTMCQRSAWLLIHCYVSFFQWPYCLKRCTYCNFNKYIPKENNDHIMTTCLQKETEALLQLSQVSW